MPIDIDIRLDVKQIERNLGAISKKVMPRALPKALNKVGRSVRAAGVQAIMQRTSLKQRHFAKRMTFAAARRTRYVALIDARDAKAPNLSAFLTAARKRVGQPGKPQFFRKRKRSKGRPYAYKGVEANAWRQDKTYKGTFVIRGRNNNAIVVRRDGDGRRAKLVSVVGPSPRRMFAKGEVRKIMLDRAAQRLPIELERAVELELRRLR